ncbi:MAG TPA: amidohydrolase family protein [Vicinamibacterales bacterium]|nr:amidohydrolase family protein [Vicinamibacterales bacterium]
MRRHHLLTAALLTSSLLWAALPVHVRSQVPDNNAVLYEGARLIIGDAAAPIENGAFVVQGGRITAIGPRASVTAPAGARRVDLTGKTVMPALVNAHVHFGYERYTRAGGEALPENFTPENLLDHLQREAFYGVGTANDGGSAPVPLSLQFQQDQNAGKFPAAARYWFNAGIVPPEGGPDAILIRGTRPLHANYEVVRANEARAAVQDVVSKKITHVKIWLGDRGGSYPAMPWQVFEAVIDEAHKNNIRVHAHALTMRDQKDALRANADVLVHMVQNAPLDEELVALVKEKKPYWATVIALGDRSDVCDNDPFFTQSLTDKMVADIRAANCNVGQNAATRETRLKENFLKMIQSGARLVLGADTGIRPGNTFGSGDHHEIAHWVDMGLSPADAIVAATSRPAEALGLTDVGTLAAGKAADFLVLDANPLDNIRNLRRISAVYLRGAAIDRDALAAKFKKGAP